MTRIFLSLASLAFAAGCAAVPAHTDTSGLSGSEASSQAVPHDITAGQAQLAARLYPKLAEAAEPNDNLFISPLSLSEGLGLALPGARGQTAAEMRAVLGWDAATQPEMWVKDYDRFLTRTGDDNRLTMSDGKTSPSNHPAFGFVPVTLSDEDFWLWAIRMEAGAPPGAQAQSLLYLTPGSDPAEAERDLRAAGATILAAYYDRGGFVEEVRPSPHEQTGPWLAKNAAYLTESLQGRIGDPHHSAADYLRETLSPMRRYGTGLGYEVAQAFTRSVRAVQQATDAPRLIAIEVSGEPGAYAGRPFVSRIATLDQPLDRLPQVSGADEAEVFATMQRIERDIWLLNGGAGNRQGTLP